MSRLSEAQCPVEAPRAMAAHAAAARGARAPLPRVRALPPVVGLLAPLWRDPARGLVRLHDRYGPVFKARLPGLDLCMVIGPEWNRLILKDRVDACSARMGNGQFSWLIGEPIELYDGEAHRQLRRVMNTQFHGLGLTRMSPLIAQVVRETVPRWREIQLWSAVRQLSIHAVLRAGLGADEEDVPFLEENYDAFTRAFFAPKIKLPGTTHWKGLKARARIDAWIGKRIEEAEQRESESSGTVLDFLVNQTNQEMTPQQVFDNLRILVFAGQETTASVLSWSLIEIALSEQLWSDLCREIPRGTDVPESLSELKNFPLVGAVLKEALRCYTPAWMVPRGVVVDDLELEGTHIPLGTMIAISPLACHHLSRYWPDPFRFDATRWLDAPHPSPDLYLPFGGGPHVCLGQPFALIEMMQVLVMVVSARMRPVLSGSFDLRPYLLGLPHPSDRIRVRFSRE